MPACLEIEPKGVGCDGRAGGAVGAAVGAYFVLKKAGCVKFWVERFVIHCALLLKTRRQLYEENANIEN